jgi:hypothetical protein
MSAWPGVKSKAAGTADPDAAHCGRIGGFPHPLLPPFLRSFAFESNPAIGM